MNNMFRKSISLFLVFVMCFSLVPASAFAEEEPAPEEAEIIEEILPEESVSSEESGCAHEYVETDRVEPSCTAEGCVEYVCVLCGDMKTESVPALGHSYEAVVTEPTETEPGYTTYTCSLCGDSYIEACSADENETKIFIINQPQDAEFAEGLVEFSVVAEASDDSPLSYQWQRLDLNGEYIGIVDEEIYRTAREAAWEDIEGAEDNILCLAETDDKEVCTVADFVYRCVITAGTVIETTEEVSVLVAESVAIIETGMKLFSTSLEMEPVSGECGESAAWLFANGVLTVSGEGAMADYSTDMPAPWSELAAQITKAVIEDGITSVGAYAFSNCTALKDVRFGNDVASIGAHAFEECLSLTGMTLTEEITFIGESVFAAGTSLELYVAEDSCAHKYAEENSLNFSIIKRKNALRDSSSLISNVPSDGSGKIDIKLNYDIYSMNWNEMTDQRIIFTLPEYLELTDNTFKINGDRISVYSYDREEGTIELSIFARSSEILFSCSLNPSESESSVLTADLKYTERRNEKTERIGSISVENERFYVAAVNSGAEVTLSGIAPADSQISIYFKDSAIETVQAGSDGSFRKTFTITGWEPETAGELKVECTGALGRQYRWSEILYYRELTSELTSLRFYHDASSEEYIELLPDIKAGIAPSVDFTYVSSNGYKFELTYTYPNLLSHVYVSGISEGVRNSIEAVYHAETGTFITSGDFCPGNPMFVPEYISIDYSLSPRVSRTVTEGNTLDISEGSEFYGYLDSEMIENAETSSIETGNENEEKYNISADVKDPSDLEAEKIKKEFEIGIKALDRVTGLEFMDEYSKYTGYLSYVIPGLDGDKYYMTMDVSDTKTVTVMVADLLDASSDVVEYKLSVLDKASDTYDDWATVADGLSLASTFVGLISKNYDICSDTEELSEKIEESSSLSYPEKMELLSKTQELQQDRQMFTLFGTVLPMIVAATGGAAAPAALLTGMLSAMGMLSDVIFDSRIGAIEGETKAIEPVMDTTGEKTVELGGLTYNYVWVDKPHIRETVTADHSYYFADHHYYYVDVRVTGQGRMPYMGISSPVGEPTSNIDVCYSSIFVGDGVTNFYYDGLPVNLIYLAESVTEIDTPPNYTGKSAGYGGGLGGGYSFGWRETIPRDAFCSCENLEVLALPNTLKSIKDNAINCPNLAFLTIPASVQTIGSMAGGLRGLTILSDSCEIDGPLDFPNIGTAGPVKSDKNYGFTFAWTDHIPNGAFCNMKGLAGVELPEGITVIGKHAFSGCKSLQTVNIPEGVQIIDDGAFENCSSLKEVVLPSSLKNTSYWWGEQTSCAGNAFIECELLKKVTVNSSDLTLPRFKDLKNLESIEFNGENNKGNEEIFEGCEKLKSLNLSNQMVVIDSLSNCTLLEDLSLGKTQRCFPNLINTRPSTIRINSWCDESEDHISELSPLDYTVGCIYYPENAGWEEYINDLAEALGQPASVFVPYSHEQWWNVRDTFWEGFYHCFPYEYYTTLSQLDSIRTISVDTGEEHYYGNDFEDIPENNYYRGIELFHNLNEFNVKAGTPETDWFDIYKPTEQGWSIWKYNYNSSNGVTNLYLYPSKVHASGYYYFDDDGKEINCIDVSDKYTKEERRRIVLPEKASINIETGIISLEDRCSYFEFYYDTGFEGVPLKIEVTVDEYTGSFPEYCLDDLNDEINSRDSGDIVLENGCDCYAEGYYYGGKKISYDAGKIIVTGGVFLIRSDMEITRGTTLEIGPKAKLTVASSAELRVNGNIVLDGGQIVISGTYTPGSRYEKHIAITSEDSEIIGGAAIADSIYSIEINAADENAWEKFSAALNSEHSFNTEVKINGTMTAQDNLVIGENVKINFSGASKFIIPEGIIVTNRGNISGDTLAVNGTFINRGYAYFYGCILLPAGGRIENGGTIEGSLESTYAGVYIGNIPQLNFYESVMTEQELRTALSAGENYITVSGSFTFGSSLTVPSDVSIDLRSKVTVPSGKTLKILGSLNIGTGGELVIEQGATLDASAAQYYYPLQLQGGKLTVEGNFLPKAYGGSIYVSADDYSSPNAAVNDSVKQYASASMTVTSENDLEVLETLDYPSVSAQVRGRVTVTEKIILPSNVSLQMYVSPGYIDESEIVIENGGSLTVNGFTRIDSGAKITVNEGGRFIPIGELYNNGTISNGDGSAFYAFTGITAQEIAEKFAEGTKEIYIMKDSVIEDTLTVTGGCSIIVCAGAELTNNGEIVFAEGAVLEISEESSLINCGSIDVRSGGSIDIVESAQVINAGTMEIEEGAEVKGAVTECSMDIWSENGTEVTEGRSLMLSAGCSTEGIDLGEILWTVRDEDAGYASVNDGYLTALMTGDGQKHEIEVTAQSAKQPGLHAEITITIYPRTATVKVYREEVDISGKTEELSEDTATVQLRAEAEPKDSLQNFTWKTSDSTVAQVDGSGLVTILKAGKVTITAKAEDGSGKAGWVRLSIAGLETADGLTAAVEMPAGGLVPGETVKMDVFGGGDGAEYEYRTSAETVATVDADGRISGAGIGTATITAVLKDDPYGRSVSVEIEVVPEDEDSLLASGFACEAFPTLADSGMIEADAEEYKALAGEYVLTPVGGTLEAKDYTFTTTDAKVAGTALSKTKEIMLTIPKGASGACTVAAAPNAAALKAHPELKGCTVTFEVYVKDYTPRIGSAKLTLNSYAEAGVSTELVPSYGNEIESVEICEKAGKTDWAKYSDLTADYADGVVTIRTKDGHSAENRTVSAKLVVTGSKTASEIPVTVIIKNSLPAVTVKQTKKLNTFYADDYGTFSVTAKSVVIESVGCEVSGYETTDNGDGTVDFTRNGGVVSKSGTMTVRFEGYNTPYVKGGLGFGTVNTKPVLSATPASATIGAEEGTSVSFTLYDKTNRCELNLDGCTVESSMGTVEKDGNVLTLTASNYMLAAAKKTAYKVALKINKADWATPLTAAYTLTVQPKSAVPVAKLKATTLTLNTNHPDAAASTVLTADQGNRAVSGTFTCPTTDAVSVTLDSGMVTARITGSAAPGSYAFTGKLSSDGTAMKDVKLTVKVVNTAATAAVSASGKLDAVQRDTGEITYAVTLKNISGNIRDAEAVSPASATAADGSGKFVVQPGGPNAKGQPTVILKLKADEEYDTKITYKLRFAFDVDGASGRVLTNDVSVKVPQSALKLTAEPKMQTVYQSQGRTRTVSYTVRLTSPAEAKIGSVEIGKLDTVFRKNLAQAASSVAWSTSADGKTLTVKVLINDTSKLTAGKSYTLPLVIKGEGSAANGSTAKLSLALKALK